MLTRVYTEERAERIWTATRDLMEHLAEKLTSGGEDHAPG